MLQKLRDKTSGWIATVVLGLLVIPFAFFGMEQYLFQRSDTSTAKIEAPPQWWKDAPDWWPVTMLWQRELINTDDFRADFELARQQQRANQGDKFDPREFESSDNKRKILDQMIDQRVLQMLVANTGVVASDEQVRDTIQAIPAFQVEGKFDPQQYQLTLASQVPARRPKEFEQQVREDLQQQLIPEQIAQSAFATETEVNRLLRLLGESRDVSIAIMPAPIPDTGVVSAAEIQKWYDSHTNQYRAPETVTVEYVDIDSTALTVPQPNEAALRAFYEQGKARFIEPEQRLASHILIKLDAKADAAAQKAAKDKAEKIAAQARQPDADFAAIARSASEDAGSKDGGGDLGWISKDMMPKPFEQDLFAMQPGQIRGPVKTEFGWHVIQLREVKAGKQTPFEQVRDQLAKEQTDAARARAYNDLTGKLVDQVYKNPNTLGPAAREAGLPVQKFGPVARGEGNGIAANPAVQRAAFSDALIQDGTVSDPVEVGADHSVLIRVVDHAQAHQLPLAQVSHQVIDAIRRDRASKAAVARVDAVLAGVRQGKPLSELAQQQQLVSSQIPALPRGSPIPDAETNAAIFALPTPVAGKVAGDKLILRDGRIMIFAVTKVLPGDPKAATEEQRKTWQAQLAQVTGSEDARTMVKTLRKQMKITVSEDKM